MSFLGQVRSIAAAVLLMVACSASPQTQPIGLAAKLELTSSRVPAGSPIKGRVSVTLSSEAAKLPKAGVSLLVCSGGIKLGDSALLGPKLKDLKEEERQAKLKAIVDELGDQSRLIFHRQSPRTETRGMTTLELPLDQEGAIYPRFSSMDFHPVDEGRTAVIVFVIFSAQGKDEKEVTHYSVGEAVAEILPPGKAIQVHSPRVTPQIKTASKELLGSAVTLEGLSSDEHIRVAFSLKITENRPSNEKAPLRGEAKWEASARGHYDFSPLVLPIQWSLHLPRPGDYTAVLEAVLPQGGRSQAVFTIKSSGDPPAGSPLLPELKAWPERAPLITAMPLPGEAFVGLKSKGEDVRLSLRGYALHSVIEVDLPGADGFGFIHETPGLRIVGAGMRPGPSGQTRSGALSWDLEVQPLLGLKPGIYTVPTLVAQDGAGESLVFLSIRTPLARADAAAGGGILGTGIPGSASADQIDVGSTRDPLGIFAARLEPDFLSIERGGSIGTTRLFVQGLDPASDQPLEVIYSDLSDGKLPGGVIPSPSSISQTVSQLQSTVEDGRTIYFLDLDFTANSQSSIGSFNYEVVVRQVGRGEVVLTLAVDVVAGKSRPPASQD